MTEYSTWHLFVWLILCCQVCEEKKSYKFENPSRQILLLAFVIWYSNINVCISVSNREKNLNHWGHLIDRRRLFLFKFNKLKKNLYSMLSAKSHSTDLLIFAGRRLTIVFKDAIEAANIKIIIWTENSSLLIIYYHSLEQGCCNFTFIVRPFFKNNWII